MAVLEKLKLDSQVAIVTSAGRGLGRAMALALASADADLVVAARTQSQIEATAEAARAEGGRCLAVPTDVTDPQSVHKMVDAAIGEFGQIDILVNNAGGYTPGTGKPVEEITDEEWHLGIETNLSATFYCCRAAIPHMLRQGGGKIINVTSGLGLRAVRDNFIYTSAKASLIHFSRALAFTYARHNIQCNLISPGLFPHQDPEASDQSPAGRFVPTGRAGRDEEMGPLCVFLSSQLASYMNGQIVALDGGGLAGGQAPTGFAPLVPLAADALGGKN